MGNFWKPQMTKLGFFTGELSAGSFVTGPLVNETAAAEKALDQTWGGAESQKQIGPAASADVAVFPWRAGYDYSGIILALAAQPMTAEALQRLRDPVGRIAERISVGIEFAREHSERPSKENGVTGIAAFARAVVVALDEPSPLVSISREIARLVGADSAALWRVEPNASMVRMVAASGLKSAEFLPLPIGQGLAGSIAQNGEPLMLADAPSDPRCLFPREARESGIVGYLGVPISDEDRNIAVIEVHSAEPHKWTESDRQALSAAASIIAEIFKSTDQRGNRIRVESAYLGLSEALQRLRTPDEVMDAVVEVLGHSLGLSRALIVPINDKAEALPARHEYAAPGTKSAAGVNMASAELTRLASLAEVSPIAVNDSRHASLMGTERAAELAVMSELIVPIRLEGTTRALLYMHQCDRLREWQRDEIEFADRVGRQLSLSWATVHSLDRAMREVKAAREESQRTGGQAAGRIRDLELKVTEMEKVANEARNGDQQTRALLSKASTAEAKARAEVEFARRAEAELRQERDHLKFEVDRVETSAQQLLDINRLKSEFIVKVGHEIEGSLQTVLGLAELFERGDFGNLPPQQIEAIRSIYSSAKRIKGDVDWLIEYGATRSRRLEEGADNRA
jgi:GAF domain-containing protein